MHFTFILITNTITMFTWIITQQVTIVAIDQWIITVSHPWTTPLHIGQSIAHDGACMSIDSYTDTTYSFFAMKESFLKTNFWTKQIWDKFNVEYALLPTDRLDGHFVSWHIDTTWNITWLDNQNDWSKKFTISFDPSFDCLVVPKWSITLNGVSLTVWEDISEWKATVRIIPQTLEMTTFWTLQKWDLCNIEFDLLAKYVTKFGRVEK